jgi:hypothetical protein
MYVCLEGGTQMDERNVSANRVVLLILFFPSCTL